MTAELGTEQAGFAKIDADINRQWSWASSAAKIPQITKISVSVPDDYDHVTLTVAVRDADITFGEGTIHDGALEEGTSSVSSVYVSLSPRAMSQVAERTTAVCEIILRDATTNSILTRNDIDVHIQPRDLWFWMGDPRHGETHERLIAQLAELAAAPADNDAVAEALTAEKDQLEYMIAMLTNQASLLARSLLASFVRPNHPEVAAISREAADVLGRTTGEPSFSAFQNSDVEKSEKAVDASVAAVFEALRARAIAYSEPPPNWDYSMSGQRIRDHAEVARGGLGTCLDTTILMAAVIEQIGLHPVLVMVPGHIFLGFWRRNPDAGEGPRPQWYPDRPVIDSLVDIAELVQGGWLGAVETTAVTIGNSVDAATATATAGRQLIEAVNAGSITIIDVLAARRAGVSPLPVVTDRSDGVTEIVVYRQGGVPESVDQVDQDSPEASLRTRRVDDQPPRYRKWKGSLFSLTATNALLNLKSNARVQPLLVPSEALGHLEDALAEDVSFALHSGHDIPDVWRARGITNAVDMWDSPDQATRDDLIAHLQQRRLYVQRISYRGDKATVLAESTFVKEIRSMAHAAKTARDERGMNPLFLCIGMLRWPYKPGHLAEAPMILVPVTIGVTRRRGDLTLSIDSTQSTATNSALIEWLRREHGMVIPELESPITDRSGLDVDAVLRGVRTEIARAGVPFEVTGEARLALLDLSPFRMWQDLSAHAGEFLDRPLIRHLVHTPTEQFVDPAAPVEDGRTLSHIEELHTPIPADSTQKQAVIWARERRTFVLQGPPGTGKSQTITNMVAECLLNELRVLFVAEKGTALAVVQRRLEQIGLGPFTLNLHHEGSNAAQVRAHLRQSLDAVVHPDTQAMAHARRRLRSAAHELREYPDHLHKPNAAGLSAYLAHDHLMVAGDGPAMAVPDQLVESDAGTIQRLREVLGDLPRAAAAARVAPDHPWRLAGPTPRDFDVAAASAAISDVLDGVEWCTTLSGPLRDHLDRVTELGQLNLLAAASHPLLPVGQELAALVDPSWPGRADDALVEAGRMVDAAHGLLAGFEPGVLGSDLDAVAAGVAEAAESRRWGRSKRVAEAMLPVAEYAPPGIDLTHADDAARIVGQLIEADRTARSAIEILRAVPGFGPAVPATLFEPDALASVRERRAELDRLTTILRSTDEWTRAVCALAGTGALSDHHMRIAGFAAALPNLLRQLNAAPDDVAAWQAGRSIVAAVTAHSAAWRRDHRQDRLLAVQKWMSMQQLLHPLRVAGMDQTRIDILDGRLAASGCEEAFERGVAQTSQAERIRAAGLDRFDNIAHDGLVDTYAQAQHEIRRQWVTDGPAALLAARGGGGRGTETGGLARELEKTRQKLGTRALLRKHAAAVQQLTPLVLCSPSSVVDLIEPGAMDFDLVVFDEASQITVPEAIGALGRAKAAIVVGDSKQMPPTKVIAGGSGADEELDDDAEEIIEDQESILSECELARVPTVSLAWHYRSQDEALIAFSNSAYYRGALSSFPTPTLMSDATGIEFRRVDGRYLRAGSTAVDLGEGISAGSNTNPVEAQAIVAAVHELARRADSPPSLGIVTFNEQQRQLISDLLMMSEDPAVVAILDENRMGAADVLFVKALEQVQGDERDTIIFSIAFSKQANGRIPTNFGPLSNGGGERRLNVAVTRARRKNVVFCSFDPAELDVAGATYQGPKDLKAFLSFAKSSGIMDLGELAPGQSARQVLRDRHRDDVAAALRASGLHVMTDVGLSNFRLDLVVGRPDRPERPLLPVLLDGESWRHRNTISDRDILPVDVLTNLMGWPKVARIWWPMWLQNRELVIEEIHTAADEAEAELDRRAPVIEPPRIPNPSDSSISDPEVSDAAARDLVKADAGARSPVTTEAIELHDYSEPEPAAQGVVDEAPAQPDREPVDLIRNDLPVVVGEGVGAPELAEVRSAPVVTAPQAEPSPESTPVIGEFRAAGEDVVGERATLDSLPDRTAVKIVRAELRDVIATEAPIRIDRLARIVAHRHDLHRVSAARFRAIDAVVRTLVVAESYRASQIFGDFVWPDHIDAATWTGYRTGGGPGRAFGEIAPEEIANAMCAVQSDHPDIDEDQLFRETAAIFGTTRLGKIVRTRLEDVREHHLDQAGVRAAL